jgi:ABC-2 type transport system ATP-binding protein
VPQERAVDPLLSARQNLRFAAGLHHLPPGRVHTRTEELLALVDLVPYGDRLVREFSGGMRRRLELAMGLVGDPQLMFLDEPRLGLDIAARRTVWQQVRRIRAAGRTVVLTTHYLDEAESLCDRVANIDAGRTRAVAKHGAGARTGEPRSRWSCPNRMGLWRRGSVTIRRWSRYGRPGVRSRPR